MALNAYMVQVQNSDSEVYKPHIEAALTEFRPIDFFRLLNFAKGLTY